MLSCYLGSCNCRSLQCRCSVIRSRQKHHVYHIPQYREYKLLSYKMNCTITLYPTIVSNVVVMLCSSAPSLRIVLQTAHIIILCQKGLRVPYTRTHNYKYVILFISINYALCLQHIILHMMFDKIMFFFGRPCV